MSNSGGNSNFFSRLADNAFTATVHIGGEEVTIQLREVPWATFLDSANELVRAISVDTIAQLARGIAEISNVDFTKFGDIRTAVLNSDEADIMVAVRAIFSTVSPVLRSVVAGAPNVIRPLLRDCIVDAPSEEAINTIPATVVLEILSALIEQLDLPVAIRLFKDVFQRAALMTKTEVSA